MGSFDDFGGTFRNLVARVDDSALPQLIGAALQKSKIGDLQTVVNGLEKGGLGQTVSSWADKTSATVISPTDVAAALGPAKVGRLADTLGLPAQSALELLAQSLPTAVGAATRSGAVVLGKTASKKSLP